MRTARGWRLTERQIETLDRLARGDNAAEAAYTLCIAESTVKARLKAIREATGWPGTTTGLVVEALRRGLIPIAEWPDRSQEAL
jgi:DNA-binding NarL/FixJ family response regulator